MSKFKLGWFSTGRDKAAIDLLEVVLTDIEKGVIPHCEVSFVFCSREEGEDEESDKFIYYVREKNIPLVCFSSAKYKPELRKKGIKEEMEGDSELIQDWRLYYDREVIELLIPYEHDLIVLAGYMLVVGEEMCRKYRMVNLHPARPGGPKGSWQEVIYQLMLQRASETGVMMHLVTPELDEGPPVTFCIFNIKEGAFSSLWKELDEQILKEPDILIKGGVKAAQRLPLFTEIREKGLDREFPLISYTVKVFAEGKVKIEGGKVMDSEGCKLTEGYDLTAMIDSILTNS